MIYGPYLWASLLKNSSSHPWIKICGLHSWTCLSKKTKFMNMEQNEWSIVMNLSARKIKFMNMDQNFWSIVMNLSTGKIKFMNMDHNLWYMHMNLSAQKIKFKTMDQNRLCTHNLLLFISGGSSRYWIGQDGRYDSSKKDLSLQLQFIQARMRLLCSTRTLWPRVPSWEWH